MVTILVTVVLVPEFPLDVEDDPDEFPLLLGFGFPSDGFPSREQRTESVPKLLIETDVIF